MESRSFCLEDWVHFYPFDDFFGKLTEVNSSREKGDGEGECQQSTMFVVTGLAGTSDGTSRGRVAFDNQTLISVKSINVGYAREVYVNV